MDCKHQKEVDEYNETANFFQKIKRCVINHKVCNGSEDICSRFEKMVKTKEENEEEAQKEAAKEEGKEEEEKEEEEKKEEE